MGLFDKKFCDICGGKIGLLGNRKLDDGNMCKDCAKLLSPFFSDRRSSTVNEIKAQLEYRKQNKAKLAAFNVSRTFGDYRKIHVDASKGAFIVTDEGVSSFAEDNPDIIPISSVTSCTLDIDEDKTEIYMQNANGDDVSYNPPRYNCSYDFTISFRVNHQYFDEFSLKLNSFSIDGMGTPDYNKYYQMACEIVNFFAPGSMPQGNMPMNNMASQSYGYNQQQFAQPNMYQQPQYGQANMYQQQPQYGQANQYGQPNMYQQPQGGFAPAQQSNMYPQNGFAPQQNAAQGWFCQACGTMNNAGNFCQNCGNRRA